MQIWLVTPLHLYDQSIVQKNNYSKSLEAQQRNVAVHHRAETWFDPLKSFFTISVIIGLMVFSNNSRSAASFRLLSMKIGPTIWSPKIPAHTLNFWGVVYGFPQIKANWYRPITTVMSPFTINVHSSEKPIKESRFWLSISCWVKCWQNCSIICVWLLSVFKILWTPEHGTPEDSDDRVCGIHMYMIPNCNFNTLIANWTIYFSVHVVDWTRSLKLVNKVLCIQTFVLAMAPPFTKLRVFISQYLLERQQ